MSRHGIHTLVGVVWLTGIALLDPVYVWWLVPVAGALALSIPMSVLSSRVWLGHALRRARLFVIPEELHPPKELRITRTHVRRRDTGSTFVDAVVDPVANATISATAGAHVRLSPSARRRRARAVTDAVEAGPQRMTNAEKLYFLADPIALSQLHRLVWTSPIAHPSWLTGCAAPPELTARASA